MITRTSIAALTITMMTLAGCAYNSSNTDDLLMPPNGAVRNPIISQNIAISGLISQAEQLRQAQRYQEAISVLERALRINPENAEVYYTLALNYLALDNKEQAQQMAEKGLTLASNPDMQQRLKTLLTDKLS